MKFRLFTAVSVLLFVSGAAFAQGTITGKVIDRKGNPVVGTKITLKDGGTATTDFDGAFEIEATNGDKAVANCVGMKEKKVRMSDDMVIKLDKNNAWSYKPTSFSPFVMLQGGWVPGNAGNDKAIIGLKVGMVKNFGWYISLNITPDDFMGKTKHDVVPNDWPKDYWYDKESFGGAFRQVSAGAIFRLGCPLHFLIGLGAYQSADYYNLYPDASGKTHRIETNSELFYAWDLGFMLSFKHFTMDFSTSLLRDNGVRPIFVCGVGYKF